MKGAPRRRGWTCGEEVHDQDIVERELGAEGIGYGENLHKFEKNGGLLSSGRLVLSASASMISREKHAGTHGGAAHAHVASVFGYKRKGS